MDNGQLPAVTELLEYFSSTWLNGQYPIAMLNVYRQDTSTNNKLEGWHNSMNRAVKKSHPNIFERITTLKMEQSATDRTTRSARVGTQPPPVRQKNANKRSVPYKTNSHQVNVR